MYHFFLLNSKIVIDVPEREVLEATVPDLQLEVTWYWKEEGPGEGGGGQKGPDFVLWPIGPEKEHLERAQFNSFGFFCFTDVAIICMVGYRVAL